MSPQCCSKVRVSKVNNSILPFFVSLDQIFDKSIGVLNKPGILTHCSIKPSRVQTFLCYEEVAAKESVPAVNHMKQAHLNTNREVLSLRGIKILSMQR
jgi:hypothetical protein